MRELNQNVSVVVPIGPLVSELSAVAVSTFTLTGADAAKVIRHNSSTELNIAGYTLSASTTTSGFYYLHLSAGTLSVLGNLRIQLTDAGLILPYAQDFVVVHSAFWNYKYNGSNVSAAVQAIVADAITSATIAAGAVSFGDQLTGLNNFNATSIWNESTRTLTAGAFNAASVWNESTRTLTAGVFNATSVWNEATRTLTAGAFTAASVWNESTRTLTAGAFNATSVWNESSRTLTAGAFDANAVSTAVTSAMSLFQLDKLLLNSAAGADVTSGSILGNMAAMSGTWADFDSTTDSLEAIRDRGDLAWGGGGGPTLEAIVSGVWSAALSAYTTKETAGADLLSIMNLTSAGNSLTADQVSTVVTSAMSLFQLDKVLFKSAAVADVTSGAILARMMAVSGSYEDYDHTTDSLEAIRNNQGNFNAASVWNEPTRTLTAGGFNATSVWNESSRTLTAGAFTAASVWNESTRTLTAGAFNATSVWNESNRTLTTGAFNAASVWNESTRTLTAGAFNATSVWNESSRTLTAGAFNATSVWNESTRTLTAGAFNAASVWNENPRTLTANTNFNDPSLAAIVSGVWSAALADFTAAGTTGERLTSAYNNTSAILLDTGTDGVAIANGAITSTKFAAGAIDAAALAADASTEISDTVWAKVLESQGSITAQQAMQVTLATLAGATKSATGFQFLTPNSAAVRVSVAVATDNTRSAVTLTFA